MFGKHLPETCPRCHTRAAIGLVGPTRAICTRAVRWLSSARHLARAYSQAGVAAALSRWEPVIRDLCTRHRACGPAQRNRSCASVHWFGGCFHNNGDTDGRATSPHAGGSQLVEGHAARGSAATTDCRPLAYGRATRPTRRACGSAWGVVPRLPPLAFGSSGSRSRP